MVTFLAVVGAVLGAVSVVLHVVAPRTQTLLDDKVEEIVDEVLKFLGQHDNQGAPTEVTEPVVTK